MSHDHNIIEKVSLIKKTQLDPNDLSVGCYFREFDNISEKEINDFRNKYHFLPVIYLDFLKLFSGARISYLDILPLNDDDIPDIHKTFTQLQEAWDHSDGYLPFAEDGGTYVYCFDEDAKVWGFVIGDYGGKPVFLAKSFEEFINEHLLGQKYNEHIRTHKNPFYTFLQKQGWV